MQLTYIQEAFAHKKAALGTVNFPKSTITDPFIVSVIKLLANNDPVKEQEIIAKIVHREAEISDSAKKAPILFHTMQHNVVEDTLFSLFWNSDVEVPGSPKFSNITFQKLIRNIQGNHAEMFPMRSFIDDRPLPQVKIDFTQDSPNDANTKPGAITTAAATPNGTFYFSIPFMQKLIDWAHLKNVQPSRAIYKAKGGPFPNEYAYIEFLILHEFMHYTNDDFYYQQTIPNAKHKIINWVGDFRSNYLLTKSGYEALPIGLFNDKINYDRQMDYIDMYRLVEQELKNLSPEDQDKISEQVDGMMGDDHEPGQAEGNSADATEMIEKKKSDAAKRGEDINDKMSEHGKEQEEKVENGTDKKDAAPQPNEKQGESDQGQGKEGGGNSASSQTDLSKVTPTFNWKNILKKCITTATPHTEETYSKINKRAISGFETIRQTGAGYLPPGETEFPVDEAHIAFVMDTSGSMDNVVPVVMANALQLLKGPAFKNSTVSMYKFADNWELHKANIKLKRSATCHSIADKPKQWTEPMNKAFEYNFSGGTSFDNALLAELQLAVRMKYNIIICSDTDVLSGSNLTNLMSLVRSAPRQVFVIFDNYNSYVKARKIGAATSNMSHF